MRLRLSLLCAIVAVLAAGSSAFAARHRRAAARPTIEVLSNRADLISGGEALVAVALPRGVKPSAVTVTLGSPATFAYEYKSSITGTFKP